MRNQTIEDWCRDVDKGWYYIVKPLVEYCLDHGLKIGQIKEKFGGLRFYMDTHDDRIYHMIDLAEKAADATCEMCGLPGKSRNLPWIKTLCEEHYTMKLEEWKSRQERYNNNNKKGQPSCDANPVTNS